jgi:hypothetical protein
MRFPFAPEVTLFEIGGGEEVKWSAIGYG